MQIKCSPTYYHLFVIQMQSLKQIYINIGTATTWQIRIYYSSHIYYSHVRILTIASIFLFLCVFSACVQFEHGT